jgi:hypothetical protein
MAQHQQLKVADLDAPATAKQQLQQRNERQVDERQDRRTILSAPATPQLPARSGVLAPFRATVQTGRELLSGRRSGSTTAASPQGLRDHDLGLRKLAIQHRVGPLLVGGDESGCLLRRTRATRARPTRSPAASPGVKSMSAGDGVFWPPWYCSIVGTESRAYDGGYPLTGSL